MTHMIEEHYMHDDILALLKSIYVLLQAERRWFKSYTNNMPLKEIFKKRKTDYCILYCVNEPGTLIFIIYVDDMLEMVENPEFMDTI